MQTKRYLRVSILASCLAATTAALGEPSTAIIGVGGSSCDDFVQVVEGDFRHPLNAVNFHGYMSWAHGFVSALAPDRGVDVAAIDREGMKLELAEICQGGEGLQLKDAVDTFLARRTSTD